MKSALTINLLNIGLMVISCITAFIIPFELFLFSYAVLGPLHYLTEISWLHKRNYFTTGKNDYLWLVILGGLMTLGFLNVKEFRSVSTLAPYAALLSGMVFFFIKNPWFKLVGVLVVLLSGAMINDQLFYAIFFLIFLPTLIHVFIFTGSFILHGALKSKSTSALLSLLVFVACALSFFLLDDGGKIVRISEYVRNSYMDFAVVNVALINFLQLDQLRLVDQAAIQAVFGSTAGMTVMRFIAFAYTYHYLNWFSKTSIIQWHKVERKYLIITLALWLFSLAVYAYDYKSGLRVLFFMSILHVFLEFPLNVKTFSDIGSEFKIRFRKAF